MPVEYTRQTSESEKRARARERVEGEARDGRQIRGVYDPEELAWAGLDEAAVDELEKVAEAAREATIEAGRRTAETLAVARETEAVIREWDAQEKAERLARARVEAAKRIAARKREDAKA